MDISALPESPDEEDESAVPVVRFISGQQLFRAIDSIESRSHEMDSRGEVDTLLVTSVSPDTFGMLERKREARGRKFRFNWYDEDSRRLLVYLNTGAHVQLHIWLYIEIRVFLFTP
ncbi:hypothetical protein J3E69DRAFT_362254 [Trichoderma sp. SZMC 28015]